MRGKNSIVKHLKWNLVITQSHHPYITPLSSWTPKTNRNTTSFSLSPVGWCVQEEILSAQTPSVCSSPSSPSPHSQCLRQCGLAGLGPKLKGRHLPPFSHTRPFPFSPLHHQKNIHTHIFFLLVGTLIINICVLWSVQRGPSLYVWSLHKRLFCLCFSWSYSRCLSILGSRWAQGLTWRIVRRSVGRIHQGFFIRRWPVFILLFILLVVVED